MKLITLCCIVALSHLETAFAAYFITKNTVTDHEFVIEITDPKTVDLARKIVAGEVEDAYGYTFYGTIIKSPAPYNPGWSFHIDPNSPIILRADNIEVCDAQVVYVEKYLEEACGSFLPDCIWCPWFAYFVKEIDIE